MTYRRLLQTALATSAGLILAACNTQDSNEPAHRDLDNRAQAVVAVQSESAVRGLSDPLDQPLPNPETDFAKIRQIAENLEDTDVPESERALLFRWMLNATQIRIGKAMSPDAYADTGKWPATVREAVEQQRQNEAAEARRTQINQLQTWCKMSVASDTNGPWHPEGRFELDGKSFDDPCTALSKSGISPEAVEAAERERILRGRIERENREEQERIEREVSESLRAATAEGRARQEEDIRMLDALQ